jgi:hypothetical protein
MKVLRHTGNQENRGLQDEGFTPNWESGEPPFARSRFTPHWESGEPRLSKPKLYGTLEFRRAMPALKCHYNVLYNKTNQMH